MNGPISKLARCAIYTRKSTEYNLELAFNSLDAQREACEAYIKSQAHEGWQLIPGRYDDGAFSGASLDRPALQQLLADVRASKIDIVLVYKVDRLTRSLADFATFGPFLDAHEELRLQNAALVRKWNAAVDDFNSAVPQPRNVGRPLAASDAQCATVLKLRKTGTSLRDIAAETSLGLWTVRTIIDNRAGTDRTSRKYFERITPDRKEVGRLAGANVPATVCPSASTRRSRKGVIWSERLAG